MTSRSPARWLAPLALVAALLAVGLVYQSTTGDESSSSTPSSSTTGDEGGSRTSTGARTTRTTGGGSGGGASRYTVKSGDTLGAIAESTGVPVDELVELNPDLDAQSLRVGQRIKLR